MQQTALRSSSKLHQFLDALLPFNGRSASVSNGDYFHAAIHRRSCASVHRVSKVQNRETSFSDAAAQ